MKLKGTGGSLSPLKSSSAHVNGRLLGGGVLRASILQRPNHDTHSSFFYAWMPSSMSALPCYR
jgi:hypothetical protein